MKFLLQENTVRFIDEHKKRIPKISIYSKDTTVYINLWSRGTSHFTSGQVALIKFDVQITIYGYT